MNDYEAFDILFYRGNSFVGRLIKLVSKSENYSHCSIFIDKIHLLETSWNHPTVLAHFGYRHMEYDVYRVKVDLSSEQKRIIMDYLRKRIHTSYDWKYIVTRAGNFLFGTAIRSSEGKYTCDELIVQAFREIGLDLLEEGSPLSPESLAKSRHLERIEEGV